jgi:hypothetical protein
MWGFRWTARFLLLVMLIPAFEPLGMACTGQREVMQCMRQAASVRPAQPAMQCHHAMARPQSPDADSSRAESPEAFFRAVNSNNCCQDHNCCCVTTSEWARPASSLLSFLSLLVQPSLLAQSTVLPSSDIAGQDSARAPPRS